MLHRSFSTVQSTSPISTVFDPENSSPSLSQSGFIFLQWPHQGARNLMNAPLPALERRRSRAALAAAAEQCKGRGRGGGGDGGRGRGRGRGRERDAGHSRAPEIFSSKFLALSSTAPASALVASMDAARTERAVRTNILCAAIHPPSQQHTTDLPEKLAPTYHPSTELAHAASSRRTLSPPPRAPTHITSKSTPKRRIEDNHRQGAQPAKRTQLSPHRLNPSPPKSQSAAVATLPAALPLRTNTTAGATHRDETVEKRSGY